MSRQTRWTPFLALLGAALVAAGCDIGEVPPEVEEVDEQELEPDPAIRPEASGTRAAVVSGHPLASTAGEEVLRQGGTATDAVVTMAAILAVVRPHMNNVGGDGFGLFYDVETGDVTALNASGRAPEGLSVEFLADAVDDEELDSMPSHGGLSVTVPGVVSGWDRALRDHGTLTLAEALEPAIELAEDGFVVTETLARDLRNATRNLNEAGQEVYRPGGEPLEPGDVLRSPALAETLRTLADEGPSALYGGSLSESLAAFLQEEGSPMDVDDFQAHEAGWAEPATVEFRGLQVHSMPPNSQGAAFLQMVGMADHLPLDDHVGPYAPDLIHDLVEVKKLAFADRARWIADPERADVPLDRLLDRDYLEERAGRIPDEAAEEVDPGFGEAVAQGEQDRGGGGNDDTVYIMAVDEDGNAVSWIQSIFHSLGSRLLEPETGIILQNRGAGFTVEEGHPNRLEPGKRPFHTLLPGMVTDGNGGFVMAVGSPGGDGQPQSNTQVLVQTLVFGLSPQQAVEAARFRSYSGRDLRVEDRMPEVTRDALEQRGHDVRSVSGWTPPFGNQMVIWRQEDGVLRTGADMRREGSARAY